MTTDFNIELVQSNNIKSALKDSGAKADANMFLLPYEKLFILPEFNVREHDARWTDRVNALAEDMMENGYMESKPMEVFIDSEGRFVVTDGHTRYAGVTLAREKGATNLDMIPVIPKKKGASMLDLTIGLVKSNSGAELSALAKAIVVKRLTNVFNKTPAEIGKALGMSPKYAGQLLTLSGAPERVKEMITVGMLSPTMAIEMLEEHGSAILDVLDAAQAKQAPGKKITNKSVKSVEDKVLSAKKANAETMFQLIELLLLDDAVEGNPQKSDILDKLDLVVSNINKLKEAA